MRSDVRAPERGFTLLEIVCTLVILGVLGSLVFSGFGTAITGYTQMREVGTSDMQAELALIRLRKELAGAADFPESPFKDSPSVTFTKTDGTQTTISCEDTGNKLLIDGQILLSDVASCRFTTNRPLLHRHRADPATRRTASHLDAFRRPPQHPPRQGLRFPMQTSQRGSVLLTIIGGIVILALLGCCLSLRALLFSGYGDGSLEGVNWGVLGFILGSVAVFAVSLLELGVLLSIALMIVISSLASGRFRAREVAVLTVFMCLLCWVIFIFGVGLQVPVLPAFL